MDSRMKMFSLWTDPAHLRIANAMREINNHFLQGDHVGDDDGGSGDIVSLDYIERETTYRCGVCGTNSPATEYFSHLACYPTGLLYEGDILVCSQRCINKIRTPESKLCSYDIETCIWGSEESHEACDTCDTLVKYTLEKMETMESAEKMVPRSGCVYNVPFDYFSLVPTVALIRMLERHEKQPELWIPYYSYHSLTLFDLLFNVLNEKLQFVAVCSLNKERREKKPYGPKAEHI